MTLPAASVPPNVFAKPTTGEIEQDYVLTSMVRKDVPINGEAYFGLNGNAIPAHWTAEHEANMPPGPQDWSPLK